MKGGLTVIRVAEPLHTSKFTNADKVNGTVLNANVTVSQVNGRISRSVKGNVVKRKNSRVRAHRSKKY